MGVAAFTWFRWQLSRGMGGRFHWNTQVTAGAAGVFNDITHLSITNGSATATIVTLKDATAGTTRGIWNISAGGGVVIPFNPPLAQATAANNWTITCGTSVASVYVNAQFVKNN